VARGARTLVTLTLTALVAAAIGWLLRSGGGASGAPIRIEGARVVVENQTAEAWHDVSVTINAYYRVRTQSIDPGGRLETPLASLETGLGQRFNPAREHVARVEVRATDPSGKRVAIDWDDNR
jgi:hypothetical protein